MKIADLREICPLGIGLYFFIGCFLSLSTSIKSFNMYTDEEIKQNEINIINENKHNLMSVKFLENNKGTKTTVFLK